jgi:hypothetical protein
MEELKYSYIYNKEKIDRGERERDIKVKTDKKHNTILTNGRIKIQVHIQQRK